MASIQFHCDQLNEWDDRKMANDGQEIDLYADDLEFNQVGWRSLWSGLQPAEGLLGMPAFRWSGFLRLWVEADTAVRTQN